MQLPVRLASALLASVMVVAGTLSSAEAASRPVPEPNRSVSPVSHPNEYANRVVAAVNDARARAGLKRLRVYQDCLDGQANRWARRLAESGRLQHRDQRRVLAACNLHWTGETLARGSRSLGPRQMVRAWMHSPPHRAVLMKPRAKLAGVGIRFDSRGYVYGVVNLGDAT